MASTFYTMVNRLLTLLGERVYSSTSDFDSTDLSLHEKVQIQAKDWFGLYHQMAMTTPRARFLLRDYTFNTASADNSYDLSAATNYERILEDSMFITTTGSEYGPMQQLDLWEYRRRYPANDESEGQPVTYYHLLRTAAVGPDAIAFSPPPDGIYAIRYSAFLKPYRLKLAADQICVDEEWDHIFLLGTAVFVEIMKAEGKAPDFASFSERLSTEFEQHTIPLAGEHMRLDPSCGGAISIYGRRGSEDSWDW